MGLLMGRETGSQGTADKTSRVAVLHVFFHN